MARRRARAAAYDQRQGADDRGDGGHQDRTQAAGGRLTDGRADLQPLVAEIGSASCRERVCQDVSISVVDVSLKKKSPTTKSQRSHTPATPQHIQTSQKH